MSETTPPTDATTPSAATRDMYDWSTVTPSTAVVETIAAHADCDATRLDPLYDTIDPDGLDAVVRSNADRETENSVSVSLEHAGYEVTVYSAGVVIVRSASA